MFIYVNFVFCFRQLPQCMYPIVSTWFFLWSNRVILFVLHVNIFLKLLISFLDHLCATNGISTQTRQLKNHVLKVTYLTMCLRYRILYINYCNNIMSSLNWTMQTDTITEQLGIFHWSNGSHFQVPQQLPGSNNCGFHLFMFVDHFLKVYHCML